MGGTCIMVETFVLRRLNEHTSMSANGLETHGGVNMKLMLRTDIFPIVDVGMYESHLDPRHMFGDWSSNYSDGVLTETDIEYCNDAIAVKWNANRYKALVAKYAIAAIAEFFDDAKTWSIFSTIQLCKDAYQIISPPFYNFTTDHLEFSITINQSEIDSVIMLVENNNDFFMWIHEQYGHRSGFISFMPFEKNKFFEAIRGKDVERAFGMYLAYVLNTEFNKESYQERLYEGVAHNHHVDEFVDDDGFHEIMCKAWAEV